MAEDQVQIIENGRAVNLSDLNTAFAEAALADDRVFAELFRLPIYNGSAVGKAILPYGISDATLAQYTVQSSGIADGKVNIYPFRCLIGSRTLPATSGKTAWRDIRSTLFVGATALQTQVSIGANSSGSPRWDLIYARMEVDKSAASVTRKRKDSTTGVVSSVSVVATLQQVINPMTVTGTPAVTPAYPALPADSAGTYYNVPLAYVRVPNGFTSGSTVLGSDIRLCAPVAQLSRAMGVSPLRGATGNDANLPAGTINAWGTAGARPETFLPCSFSGGEEVILLLSTAVHATGAILDASRDWRYRLFETVYSAAGSPSVSNFATCNSVVSSDALVPIAGATSSFIARTMLGQSCWQEATGSLRRVAILNNATCVGVTAPDIMTIYVAETGELKLSSSVGAGGPYNVFLRIRATSQFPNFS